MKLKRFSWGILLGLTFGMVLVFPIGCTFFLSNSIEQQGYTKNINSLFSIAKRNEQSSTDKNAFLPGTNLSLSEYLDGDFKNTYNVSIISINRSNIDVKCDYSITKDFFENPFTSPFYTSVNRTSENHSYQSNNYYNWYGLPQTDYEFWIDPTGFQIGYIYENGGVNLTVTASETVFMEGLGEFDAWKVVGTDPDYGIVFTFRYATSGLFLCLNYVFVSPIWYNLTTAELTELPQEYTGPSLVQISPNNNSIRPSGTNIAPQFISPYGIDIIYYQWDSATNSTSLTPLPSENGPHDLYITTVDNLGFSMLYYFVFTTDNSQPGISLLNYQNDSSIKGSSQIQLAVSSGNGSVIFYWNGSSSNTTVNEGTAIDIANSTLETLQILNIFVKSPAGIWTYNRFVFRVDNSPPSISIDDFINNSDIKGKVDIRVSVSERSNLTYSLEPISENGSIIAETGMNHTLSFSDLANGSYRLVISATDEANNTNETTLIFSIHTSAFDWNWDLKVDSPNTLNIVDTTGKLWFQVTLVSKTNQTFNLTVLPESSPPTRINTMLYVIKFTCDVPEDILFMTFTFPLNDLSSVIDSSIEVYKWAYWDNQENKWLILDTSYNAVSHSWQATHEGNTTLFALIKTDETTSFTSVIPGGGQIPSFEYSGILLGLFFLRYLLLMRKKSVKKTLNGVQGEQ